MTPKPVQAYRYLLLLAMLNAVVLSTSTFLGYKLVGLWHVREYGTTILFPITYFFGDVIAEVYGYKISRHLIWTSMVCCIISAALAVSVTYMPPPADWHDQQAYITVLGPSLRVAISSVAGIIAGAFVNAYAISKWKILVRGRYFWFRSIAATAIGEAVLTAVSVVMGFTGRVSWHQIMGIVISAYLFKLIYAILAAYPATLLVRFLKKAEQVDIYDYHVNYSPFKFAIDWEDVEGEANAK